MHRRAPNAGRRTVERQTPGVDELVGSLCSNDCGDAEALALALALGQVGLQKRQRVSAEAQVALEAAAEEVLETVERRAAVAPAAAFATLAAWRKSGVTLSELYVKSPGLLDQLLRALQDGAAKEGHNGTMAAATEALAELCRQQEPSPRRADACRW